MGWLVFFLFIFGLGLLVATGCNSEGFGDSIGISILIVLGFIVSGSLILQGILYFIGYFYWFYNHWFFEDFNLSYWEVLGNGIIGFIPITFIIMMIIGMMLPERK